MKNSWNWKIIAIVFIFLFTFETLWILVGFYLLSEDEAQLNKCYYEICNDYPEATLEGNVCFCYEYDSLGYLINTKTEYMD